ncbi:MAG TPA: DUF559 domain-containing protein [Gammaproteobacteria bacterium]
MRYRKDLKPLARTLRNNQTLAEQKLWKHLRRDQLGVRFYRQRPIAEFIVDFLAPTARLIVEVDGGRHFEADAREQDASRTAKLGALGFNVVRFDNRQVMCELDAVLAEIFRVLR